MSRQIVLPTKKTKPTRKDPRVMILYSKPKAGKTTLLSTLPNNMNLDLEGGTAYLEALSMRIIGISPPAKESDEAFEARMQKEVPEYYLIEAGKAIMDAGRPFDFVTVDTATKLEEMVLPLAKQKYKNTPMGANYQGTDVRELPRGAGYLYLRLAYMEIINKIKKLADNVILVGHLKDSVIEKQGKEVESKDLDLTGKLKSILCADADAIAYLHRGKDNELLLNFQGSDEVLCGARCTHIRGKVVKIADYDEENNCLTNINWSLVYPDKINN